MKPVKPTFKNGSYHLVRRVPKRYAAVEPRAQIWLGLSTDSEAEAMRKAPGAWAELVGSWEARLAGDSREADQRYGAAQEIAKKRGFRYVPADQVAKLPIEDLLRRIEAIENGDGRRRTDVDVAKAVLGAVPKPAMTVSKALEEYWRVASDKTLGKSDDQVRRWENPRKKAVKNFIEVCGDLDISAISPDDMQDFRDWWLEKIKDEGLTPNSANKDLVHIATILRTVDKAKRLNLNLPLAGWAIKNGEKRSRPPFSTAWIKDRILAPGALAGLNTEARCLVLGMVNTGYRPSEAEQLTASQIRLDANIPHISIEPVGRTLKSQYARRKIPLLGVSLEAFRECPDGFPRYREGSGVSNLVNKFLANNRLLESDEHSLYGLRHSFQDRMIAAKVDDRTRREIFGHALTEERYGDGASLEMRRDALLPVAL